MDAFGLASSFSNPKAVIFTLKAIGYEEFAFIYGAKAAKAALLALAAYMAADAAKPWLLEVTKAITWTDTSCPDPCKGNKDFEDVAKKIQDLISEGGDALWKSGGLSKGNKVIGDGGAIDAAIHEAKNPGTTVGGQVHGQKIKDSSNKLKKLLNRVNQENKKFPKFCQDRLRPVIENLKKKLDDAITQIDAINKAAGK